MDNQKEIGTGCIKIFKCPDKETVCILNEIRFVFDYTSCYVNMYLSMVLLNKQILILWF